MEEGFVNFFAFEVPKKWKMMGNGEDNEKVPIFPKLKAKNKIKNIRRYLGRKLLILQEF